MTNKTKNCVLSRADCFLRPGMKGSMLADNIILAVASNPFNISLKMTFFSIILVKLVDFFGHEDREARICVKLARGYEARAGVHFSFDVLPS